MALYIYYISTNEDPVGLSISSGQYPAPMGILDLHSPLNGLGLPLSDSRLVQFLAASNLSKVNSMMVQQFACHEKGLTSSISKVILGCQQGCHNHLEGPWNKMMVFMLKNMMERP